MFRLNNIFSPKELWRDLVYTRHLIWLSTALFLIAMLIGFTNNSLANYLNSQLMAVGELANLASGAENETLAFILIIFINNAVKCIMVIFLGMFFGLYPIFFIGMNGLVIGYILNLAASGDFHFTLFDTIVKGLLPHGILEIPALILACAYGLRLGKLLWQTIIIGIRESSNDRYTLKGIGFTYKGTFKRAGVMSMYLTIVLAIASIIESTVTVWLLSL